MFAAIMRRAQVTVDHAVDQVVNKAIVAIPFVIAAAFGTAALAFRLVREYGPETANVILAILFVAIGLIAALIVNYKQSSAAGPDSVAAAEAAETASPGAEQSSMSDTDKDLLKAALTSAAPLALPRILRLIARNLPLVLSILAALFILMQSSAASQSAPIDKEPSA